MLANFDVEVSLFKKSNLTKSSRSSTKPCIMSALTHDLRLKSAPMLCINIPKAFSFFLFFGAFFRFGETTVSLARIVVGCRRKCLERCPVWVYGHPNWHKSWAIVSRLCCRCVARPSIPLTLGEALQRAVPRPVDVLQAEQHWQSLLEGARHRVRCTPSYLFPLTKHWTSVLYKPFAWNTAVNLGEFSRLDTSTSLALWKVCTYEPQHFSFPSPSATFHCCSYQSKKWAR